MTGKNQRRVAILWERFGPYHHARMEAAAPHFDLHGIEVLARDSTYAWDEVQPRAGYSLHRLGPLPLESLLDDIEPQYVAVPGWDDPHALAAVRWARRAGVRVIMMSDSNAHDLPRHPVKEWLKRGVINHVDAGFAAGSSARSYLVALGLERERVALGYDSVDNGHFARPGDRPAGRGFLVVARFVAKKNLPTMLAAYAAYRAKAGSEPWPLVLAGDGPLRSTLEEQVKSLGLEASVTMTGFLQYAELPELYHRCGTLVLPSLTEQWGLVVNEAMAAGLPVLVSEAAGCAPDLVVDGETGFRFAPGDVNGLVDLMLKLASPGVAAAMGEKAAQHIDAWGLANFAAGLARAVAIADVAPSPRGPALRLSALRLRSWQ